MKPTAAMVYTEIAIRTAISYGGYTDLVRINVEAALDAAEDSATLDDVLRMVAVGLRDDAADLIAEADKLEGSTKP
jgi:hypothetical protein